MEFEIVKDILIIKRLCDKINTTSTNITDIKNKRKAIDTFNSSVEEYNRKYTIKSFIITSCIVNEIIRIILKTIPCIDIENLNFSTYFQFEACDSDLLARFKSLRYADVFCKDINHLFQFKYEKYIDNFNPYNKFIKLGPEISLGRNIEVISHTNVKLQAMKIYGSPDNINKLEYFEIKFLHFFGVNKRDFIININMNFLEEIIVDCCHTLMFLVNINAPKLHRIKFINMNIESMREITHEYLYNIFPSLKTIETDIDYEYIMNKDTKDIDIEMEEEFQEDLDILCESLEKF